jgi:hypothetical protein
MPVDLYWTLDEDYAIGKDGDLRDTSFDIHRSTWQEVRTRAKAETGDWRDFPEIGANLMSLLGNINNRQTAEEGKARIQSSLTRGGFLQKEQIKIRYLPLTKHTIMYEIHVSVSEDGQTRMLKVQLLWNTEESGFMEI